MKEHDILDALGQVSEETVSKYALSKSEPLKAAGKEHITMSKSPDNKKKSVRVNPIGIAAAVALCIGLNAAVIYGVSRMKQDADGGLSSPAAQISEEDSTVHEKPYVQIVDAMPTGASVRLRNPTEETVSFNPSFAVLVGDEMLPVNINDVQIETSLVPLQSYVTCFNFPKQLPAGTYTMVNLDTEGKTSDDFEETVFEISEEFNNMVYITEQYGKSSDEAIAEIESKGLIAKISDAEDNTSVKGRVVYMTIEESDSEESDVRSYHYDGYGYWVLPGTTCILTVDGGDVGGANYRLPDMVGWDFEVAKEELLSHGMYVDKRSSYSSEVEAGKVISTDPEADTWIVAGSYVQITVSLGNSPETVPVPNFVGMDWAKAKITADALKLSVTKIEIPSDEPVGRVLEQNVEPGEEIAENTVIDLTVSAGKNPEQISIPVGIPAGVNDKFTLRAKPDGGTVLCEQACDPQGAAGSAVLTVYKPSEGSMEFTVYADFTEKGVAFPVARYEIRSDSDTYETIFDNTATAFTELPE